eukprot:365241-Chlamydomonas_euryale.AAC.21
MRRQLQECGRLVHEEHGEAAALRAAGLQLAHVAPHDRVGQLQHRLQERLHIVLRRVAEHGGDLFGDAHLQQRRHRQRAVSDDLAAQPDVVHVVVGMLQRQELEELRREAHRLDVAHVRRVDLQQAAQQLPEIRVAAAERALGRQAWRDAIQNLAPLELKKPQQDGRMTQCRARSSGSG